MKNFVGSLAELNASKGFNSVAYRDNDIKVRNDNLRLTLLFPSV